ncbi:MAG: ThuA domain-containing protein, partial [Verrucomicrobiales bacterium]
MKTRPTTLLPIALLTSLVFAASPEAQEEKPAADPKPIRALMITGGCCHDYEKQKLIISSGISERAKVDWTIIHEGGTSRDHKVSVYSKPDWADGYDVILHNECFGALTDDAFIEGITKAHKDGVASVALHCSA